MVGWSVRKNGFKKKAVYSGSRALSGEYPIEALIITLIAFLGLQGVLLSRENRVSAGPE